MKPLIRNIVNQLIELLCIMPTILLANGFRFYFYMNEHLPIHVHVKIGGSRGRIILDPSLDFHRNQGFTPSEVRKIVEIVEIVVENYDHLIEKWYETFNK